MRKIYIPLEYQVVRATLSAIGKCSTGAEQRAIIAASGGKVPGQRHFFPRHWRIARWTGINLEGQE